MPIDSLLTRPPTAVDYKLPDGKKNLKARETLILDHYKIRNADEIFYHFNVTVFCVYSKKD